MKQELFEFALHQSLPSSEYLDIVGFSQRMPHGQIVYGKKNIPRHLRPLFPGHETLSHRPELHRRYSPVFAGAARIAAVPLLVAYPFVTATAHYPLVAGPQYQSSVSGQMAGSDPNLLFGKPQGLDYFFSNF